MYAKHGVWARSCQAEFDAILSSSLPDTPLRPAASARP